MDNNALLSVKQRFGIIGNSPLLNRALEVALRVAPTDLTVLVTGESGVGKEFFPQIIHAHSARKHNKYVAVNCGAIPEGTIDSELFGHEKGAFTGAIEARKGYFEEADGGTIFLDEVGELPLATQVRLLRVLQTGEFMRVGSAKVQKTNVRVVAATNSNLMKAIADGRFREDLYYRLNTIEIKVPALRERKDDIPLLFRKFVVDFAEQYRMPAIRLTEEATEVLKAYYWQGNVRQLKNVAMQISLIEERREISAEVLSHYLPAHQMNRGLAIVNQQAQQEIPMEDLKMLYNVVAILKHKVDVLESQMQQMPRYTDEVVPYNPVTTSSVSSSEGGDKIPDEPEEVDSLVEVKMTDVQKETIRKSLVRNKGNRKATAAELGLSERTLYRKIKEYSL